MPSSVSRESAFEAAVECIMTESVESPISNSDECRLYSNYFSTSAAPLDRYTDALVAEIGSAEHPAKPRLQLQLPRLSTLAAATAAASNFRVDWADQSWRWGRRKRRVTFADEVGLQLERVARQSDFCSCSGEESAATSPVANDNNDSESGSRSRRSTVCGFFSRGGSVKSGQRQSFSDSRPPIRLSMLHLRQDGTLVAMATVTAATASRVFARVTLDNWSSYRDVEASYGVQDSGNPASDTTVCSVELLQHADHSLRHLQQLHQLEFCFCLQRSDSNGNSESLWDNNCGRNYRLKLPVMDLCPIAE